MSDSIDPIDAAPDEARAKFEAAFVATAAARAALAKGDLIHINVDVKAAVAKVIGALPRLAKLRAAIGQLPGIDVEQLDQLKTFAEALFYANVGHLAAPAPRDELPVLGARGTALRDSLLFDARTLARHGLIDAKPLAEIKRATGYLLMATELGILVRVLRDRWAEIATKTPIREADLAEAEGLVERITWACAARTRRVKVVAKANDDRRRAYTLMVGAYDQVRRAVSFLRWGGDVEEVAPSLWAGRRKRGAKRAAAAKGVKEEGSPVAAPGAGAAPTPTGPRRKVGRVATGVVYEEP